MPTYRDCAVVYVAWNLEGAVEALASARSVRRAMRDVAIYLKLASSVEGVAGKRWRVFDHVVYVRAMKCTFADKFHFLAGVKEKRVLYLDADTYVVSGLRDAFDLLDRFDLACAHAPWRFPHDFGPDDTRLPRIPSAFPEFNAGVIFCRNIVGVRRLLRTCRQLYAGYAEGQSTTDQPALRYALWASSLSLYVLPPEYNARLCFPAFLSGEAKILHARMRNLEEAARIANASLGPRTLDPKEFG